MRRDLISIGFLLWAGSVGCAHHEDDMGASPNRGDTTSVGPTPVRVPQDTLPIQPGDSGPSEVRDPTPAVPADTV